MYGLGQSVGLRIDMVAMRAGKWAVMVSGCYRAMEIDKAGQ